MLKAEPRYHPLNLKVPFGYNRHPQDPHLIVPDEKCIIALEYAIKFVKNGGSLREAAWWLQKNTGVKVTHVTMRNYVRQYNKRLSNEHYAASVEKAKNMLALIEDKPNED